MRLRIINRKSSILATIYLTLCASFLVQGVSGQWLEAEDNPSAPIKFAEDKNASGGMVTWGTRWYRLAEVPLPMNKQPVYMYIYAKTADNKKQYFMLSSRKRNYNKTHLPFANKWCWIKLGPMRYNGFPVSIRPGGTAGIKSYLDGFVMSRSSQLTDAQLNEIKNAACNGKIAIGKCAKAPLVDGKLNDACWKRTITVSPFLLNRSSEFAKEQTRAYLTYDDKNIYVGFRCEAIVLDPKQNRLHEFADKVKDNDNNSIFKDDCVIMLFSPKPGLCYEITVNANGAVIDAKCKSPNYWKNRDIKWNSGAVAKGVRRDGFWTLEAAIPRSALNADNCSSLKFIAGRINQAEKESSSFSMISGGFHDAEALSQLRFRENVPAVGLEKFPIFNSGNNVLSINIGGGEKGSLQVEQLIRTKGQPPKIFKSELNLYKKNIAEAPLKVAGGKLDYTVILRDTSNSEVLLETPVYKITPSVSSVKAEIKSSAKYKFLVNGEENGSQLNRGMNVLALKAGKGTSAKIAIGSEIIMLDSSWKFTVDGGKNWNDTSCDTSKWEKAPVKDGVLQKDGCLRKIVIVDETELWPNWSQRGVNICRGSSQQFFFPLRGLKGIKNAVDFKMNIELPVGFEFLGASSYYKLFETPVNKAGTVKRNGVEFNKYQITLSDNKHYREKLPRLYKYCAFAIRAPHKRKNDADMYYYASSDGSYISEIPQKLNINLLPELYGKHPRKIIFQLWTGWLRRMSNVGLQQQIAIDCNKAGFNQLNTYISGLSNFGSINFQTYSLDFRQFAKEHPDMVLIDSKGRRKDNLACPSVLLNEPAGKKYLEEAVAAWLKKNKVDHVDWDYEYETFNSAISCYCPRCLKAFGHGSLSPAQIRKKYEEKWIDFMTGRMADVAGAINNALHKIDPKIVFSVYSGYQSERTKSRYGVDWSKLKGKIQIAMCGYGRSEKCLEDTRRAIGKTKLVLGAIAHPNKNTDRSYPTYCSAAKLMRRLIDSEGGGVLVFALTSLDGRTFDAMSKVSSLAAEYENFFINGKRVDSAISCNAEYAVLQWNRQKLLILLNQERKDRKFKIDLRKAAGVFDFYNRKKLGGKYISGSIAPGEIKAYLIK